MPLRDLLPTDLRDAWDRRRSRRTTLLGVPTWFLNDRADIDDAHLERRFVEALTLIGAHAPRSLARLRTDVAHVWVRRWPNRGIFFGDTRVMVIDTTFVVNPDFVPAQVAATIVHEGVHARVTAMGVARTAASIAKEERLARRAEIDFGRRAPGGAAVVERALAILAMSDEEVAPRIDLSEAEAKLQVLRRIERQRG
jgi:hypothetical protein